MKSQLSLVSVSILAVFLLAQPAPAQAKLPFFGAGDQEMPSLAPMLENVTPAVVNISVAGSREVRQRLPGALEQFLGRGGELRQEQPFRGLGSGVIIDAKKGYVVTNHHVINEASDIQVTLKDGRSYKAKKIGEDPESDIALLQIEADDLKQLELADSDALRVGDFTIAIGNPFGLGQTVTSGIVSALGRGGLGIEGYEDFIQTDAAINSGNSGGALVNLKGQLIGINTAILGPNGGNIGIGFAIPANMMKNLVAQFVEYGEVRRGSLGVRGGDLNSEIAKAMKAKTNKGGWVQEVIPGSAADKAGLKSGDIITHLNGRQIDSFTEIRAKIATLGVGKEIALGILREDKAMTVKVTLEAAEATTAEAKVLHPMLTGASLTDGKTPDGEDGVVINGVEQGSPAAALGLEKGDVIVGVSRSRVTTTKELRDILGKSSGVIALQVQRGNRILYVLIR
jgi:Do/DeqQ family serine protease